MVADMLLAAENGSELPSIFREFLFRGKMQKRAVSQDSQKYVNKGVNKVDSYEERMKKLHDAEILVQGCFAFGADSEDKSVSESTGFAFWF